jgi:hypothetical protein
MSNLKAIAEAGGSSNFVLGIINPLTNTTSTNMAVVLLHSQRRKETSKLENRQPPDNL